MILTDKDKTSIMFKCECGCVGFEITKYEGKDIPTEYYISTILSAFYVEQEKFFKKLKNRLKVIWYILKYGTHRFQEIILSAEDFKELKEVIKTYE